MKRTVIKIINFYQKWLSFDSGLFRFVTPSPQTCKFYPTCSYYSAEAIDRFGVLYGSFLALLRIFRCNPFSKGGYDPVPSLKNCARNKQ